MSVPPLAITSRGELEKIRSSLHSPNERPSHTAKRPSSTSNSNVNDESTSAPSLRSFTIPDPLSNVILIVDDVSLYVHKEVLSAWSPVFMAMFASSFLEAEQGKVNLSGKSVEDIQLLLNILYPPNTHTVTKENVMQILPLAEEYDISSLKLKCQNVILSFEPSLDMLVLARDFGLDKVKEKAISACAQLPLASIDHRANENIVANISVDVMLDVYREKIVNQRDTIRQLQKSKRILKDLLMKANSWGRQPNAYTCDQHRNMQDDCVHCLSNFRSFIISKLSTAASP